MMRLVCLAASFCLSTAAFAAPSVFVTAEPNQSWWRADIQARILGTAVGPVTAAKLTAYIEQTQIYNSYAVCALESVQPDSFVGVDRTTQASIDAYRGQVAWRAEAVAPGGRKILGQSVLFEGCDGEDVKGAALLVTDADTGEILRWQPLGSFTGDDGREKPAWVLFMSPRDEGGDELFSFSHCTECGARTNVYYDVTRRRVYTEYNGH